MLNNLPNSTFHQKEGQKRLKDWINVDIKASETVT